MLAPKHTNVFPHVLEGWKNSVPNFVAYNVQIAIGTQLHPFQRATSGHFFSNLIKDTSDTFLHGMILISFFTIASAFSRLVRRDVQKNSDVRFWQGNIWSTAPFKRKTFCSGERDARERISVTNDGFPRCKKVSQIVADCETY